MWLTLLILHLILLILIFITIYLICKRKPKEVESDEPKSHFTLKLNKIKKRLEKLKNNEPIH